MGQGSGDAVRVAVERIKLAMVAGKYAPGDEVTVLCDGHIGPLALPNVPTNVLQPGDSAELVGGQEGDWLRVMSAEEVLNGGTPSGWEAA